MRIDERQLNELITESQDMQRDALRHKDEVLSNLRDLRADRGAEGPGPEDRRRFDESRRALLKKLGLGAGAYAGKAAFAGGLGAAITGVLATPANAQEPMAVQLMRTNASLEILAVQTYKAALGLPFIAGGNPVIVTFAQTTMDQHDEHGQAFNAMAEQLGGEEYLEPNPFYAQTVEKAMPSLTDVRAVVELAATLEEVAADTYLEDLSLIEEKEVIELVGSVMGVEVQHLVTLQAVGLLLAGDAADLIAIPTDLAALPAAAGSAGIAQSFAETSPETVALPETIQ